MPLHVRNSNPKFPVLAFPRHEDGVAGFEKFTAQEINDLANKAAMLLINQRPTLGGTENAETITLLGQGTVPYVATFLALAKLGYSVFLVSPRLSAAAAVAALLAKTECSLLMFTKNLTSKVKEMQALRNVKVLPMVTRPELDLHRPSLEAPNYDTQSRSHSSQVSLVWHSSGSTGDPKDLPHDRRRCRGTSAFGSQSSVLRTTAPCHLGRVQLSREHVRVDGALQLSDDLLR